MLRAEAEGPRHLRSLWTAQACGERAGCNRRRTVLSRLGQYVKRFRTPCPNRCLVLLLRPVLEPMLFRFRIVRLMRRRVFVSQAVTTRGRSCFRETTLQFVR